LLPPDEADFAETEETSPWGELFSPARVTLDIVTMTSFDMLPVENTK